MAACGLAGYLAGRPLNGLLCSTIWTAKAFAPVIPVTLTLMQLPAPGAVESMTVEAEDGSKRASKSWILCSMSPKCSSSALVRSLR